MSRRQLAGFLLLTLIWGSTWAAIHVVVAHMPPLRSVAWRFLLATVILVPILLLRRQRLPRGRQWAVLFVMSMVMIALPFGLVAWSQQRISSGTTAVLFTASPLLTALLEPHMGRRLRAKRASRAELVAMLFGFGGMLLVFLSTITSSFVQTGGALAVLLAMVIGSAGSIWAKSELESISLLSGLAVQFLFASILIGLASLLFERSQKTAWTVQSVAAMLFLGVISSALGFLLFYWLLQQIEPYKLATRQLIMPLVAITEGFFLLHEGLPWTMVAGTPVVLGSVWIVLRSATMSSRAKSRDLLLVNESVE
jgi:drug/metabolite transporter (DMT)-like permease